MAFLKSLERLPVANSLRLLAIPIIFWCGWWGRGVYNRQGAETHYANRLTELLRFDGEHLQRPYEEAIRSNRARSWNDEFRQVHYLLMRAESDRCDLKKILSVAVEGSRTPASIQNATVESLIRTHEQARDELGLYATLTNRGLLFAGRSPLVTRGEGKGQLATVDHIIPVLVAPQLGHLPVNLQWMPSSENSSKKAEITLQAQEQAKELFEAGIISREEFLKGLEILHGKEDHRGLALAWKQALGL